MMTYLLRALVMTAALALPNWARVSTVAASPRVPVTLSRSDRLVGGHAAVIAGHSPLVAMHWLRTQRAVQSVQLGRDKSTLDLHFADGRTVVILPSAPVRTRISVPLSPRIQLGPRIQPLAVSHAAPARRAVVLEPFATELDLGTSAGQDEANALTRSGFAVDIFRNAQVTVSLMETLSAYSVIYFQTHAGLLPNGDAVVVTGERDQNPSQGPYENLYQEHSLIQAFVAGDPKKLLYDSITANFVDLHMGMFPADSLLFLNGCATLSAYTLVSAFHARNLSTVISWDGELYTATNDASGIYVMARLALGETVSQSIQDARVEGIGTSIVGNKPSRLGYNGNGAVSLAAALSGGVKPAPTPVPVATPVPTQPGGQLFSGRWGGPLQEL